MTFPFDQHYQQSDFIAVAKISKIDSVIHYNDQRDIEIEIITLYKGAAVTKLKIDNHLKTNCGIYTPLYSTWLIFAIKKTDGTFSFNLCSQSIQLDGTKDYFLDTQSKTRLDAHISRMLKVLDFLKDQKLIFSGEKNVGVREKNTLTDSLRGFQEPAYNFSAYELIITPEQSIPQIKTLKSFENKALTEAVKQQLKTAKVYHFTQTAEANTTHRFLILFFFYPAAGTDQSLVSRYLW